MKNGLRFGLSLAAIVLAVGLQLGAKEWTPGVHSNIPCIKEPKRKLDVFIPSTYQQDDKYGLPVLFLFHPNARPRISWYNKWAEKRQVILVAVKSSRNGPVPNNIRAHTTCLNTLSKENLNLNMNKNLYFSTGSSGGAQSSWRIAMTYPEHFSGVLMAAQGGWQRLPAKHAYVTFVRGEKERMQQLIDFQVIRLAQQGNPVNHFIVPGGHVSGPQSLREGQLDWMVAGSRATNPKITEAERTAYFKSELERIGEMPDADQQIDACEFILDVEALAKKKGAAKLLQLWRELKFKKASAMEDKALKLVTLSRLVADDRIKGSKHRKDIESALAALKKDVTIKDESSAIHDLLQLAKSESGDKKGSAKFDQSIAAYRKIVKKYPKTHTAKLAAQKVDELAAKQKSAKSIAQILQKVRQRQGG